MTDELIKYVDMNNDNITKLWIIVTAGIYKLNV